MEQRERLRVVSAPAAATDGRGSGGAGDDTEPSGEPRCHARCSPGIGRGAGRAHGARRYGRWTLPWPCSNADYEARMQTVCDRAVAEGITAVAFGDLFLEDVRAYRVRQMEGTGLELLFPAWGIPTDALAREMVAGGVKAKITCVDPRKLPGSFAGSEFDADFLDALPAGVDPCGENGEFHSYVYEAPVFSRPIAVRGGEVLERDGFVFADVIPLWRMRLAGDKIACTSRRRFTRQACRDRAYLWD